MKISIMCSSKEHPVYAVLEQWQLRQASKHTVELVQTRQDLSGGDLLFLISCSDIIRSDVRAQYNSTLVIHASDLPIGRGWSPHIWQILDGKKNIPITLLEAEDKVDSGAIWAQKIMHLEGHELFDEINALLFKLECELMDYAVEHFNDVKPMPQREQEPTYYRKRTPDDSRIDPGKTIEEQFDLLRVADSQRFPAFFDYRGCRYLVKLEKMITAED